MPHQHAAWALLAERLDAAAWLCSELCAGRGTAIAAQLEPVLDAIRQIAASLAAHLADGSPQAALAAAGPRLLAADIDALATACARILDGITAGPSPGEASRAAGELLSALRDVPGSASRPAAGDPEFAAAAGRLREAVLAATRLRAGLGPPCPPELTEVVAALQDLLLRVAPPRQEPAWRDDLWRAQSGLAASIQAARNGPYLATNVPAVVNHLGIAAGQPRRSSRCAAAALPRSSPPATGPATRTGSATRRIPARVADQPGHLSRPAGDGVRQPRHLPALRLLHRPAARRFPRQITIRSWHPAADGWMRSSGPSAIARPGPCPMRWAAPRPAPTSTGRSPAPGDRDHRGRPVPGDRRDPARRRRRGAGRARPGQLS